MKKNFYILSMCMLPLGVWAQSKQWSQTDCINYAVQHNISVKKTELNQQTAEINLSQAKDNRLPTVSGSASANLNNGSAINQISNERVSRRTFSNNFGVSASMPLYQGNKLNLQIDRSQLQLEQNELYVNSQYSKQKTAEGLYIHLNTVKYRLQQIEKLFDIDFEKDEKLIRLAMLVHHV